MVDHIAHHPEVRDLALFVGNPEDIVEERLGPQLPMIRDWTERHFAFTGYITGFSPAELPDPGALRAELDIVRMSGSAWSAWAAQASAPTFCGA
jgi:hypothetical protein